MALRQAYSSHRRKHIRCHCHSPFAAWQDLFGEQSYSKPADRVMAGRAHARKMKVMVPANLRTCAMRQLMKGVRHV